MTQTRDVDCQLTVLTPCGRGAIATLAMVGDDAASLLSRTFVSTQFATPQEIPLGRIAFGRWASGDAAGEEVVVCRKNPRLTEIHCHGGRAVVDAFVTSLELLGARRIDAEMWLIRQGDDHIACEARLALRSARTETTARVLLDQFRGSLRRALEQIRQQLLQGNPTAALKGLRRLDQMARVGEHLTTPWRIVIAGLPNAGKSSLFNAILGFPRAIVLDQPGTTRDVLTSLTALDGWPVELCDTAGICASHEEIESAGVARARAQMSDADLVILVLENSRPWSAENQRLLAECPAALIVKNKSDRPASAAGLPVEGFLTSALTGHGLHDLLAGVVRRIVPRRPQPGEAVPFSDRQISSLRDALTSLEKGRLSLALGTVSSFLS